MEVRKVFYTAEPTPVPDASAVRASEYRALALLVLEKAKAVHENSPDYILWKTDREAWRAKKKREREEAYDLQV